MKELSWWGIFILLIVYFFLKYIIKGIQKYPFWNKLDKFMQAALLLLAVWGIVRLYINPEVIETEYAKSNINGEIELKYNVRKISGVRETTNFLVPLQLKNVSFYKNKIFLKTHRPNTKEEANKFIYQVIYIRRKLF